jgi:hypothetical protein
VACLEEFSEAATCASGESDRRSFRASAPYTANQIFNGLIRRDILLLVLDPPRDSFPKNMRGRYLFSPRNPFHPVAGFLIEPKTNGSSHPALIT